MTYFKLVAGVYKDARRVEEMSVLVSLIYAVLFGIVYPFVSQESKQAAREYLDRYYS